MRVVVADPGLGIGLPEPLARAGWTLSRDLEGEASPGVALIGIDVAKCPARVHELGKRLCGIPLVVVARVPPPASQEIAGRVAGLFLPAFAPPGSTSETRRRPTPRLVPVTTFGPVEGLPWGFHRQVMRMLRAAGISVSLHGDMQAWLTSTASWMTPLGEAMLVAAARGSDLRCEPGLVALAARAGREQIGLMRSAGLRVESRARWLHAISESLAIEAFGRLAERAQDGDDPPWLPTAAEAIAARRLFRSLRDVQSRATPAADHLNGLVLELAVSGSARR